MSLFGIQKSNKQSSEINLKFTKIDAQFALETNSKNLLNNGAFFDSTHCHFWDNLLFKNGKKARR